MFSYKSSVPILISISVFIQLISKINYYLSSITYFNQNLNSYNLENLNIIEILVIIFFKNINYRSLWRRFYFCFYNTKFKQIVKNNQETLRHWLNINFIRFHFIISILIKQKFLYRFDVSSVRVDHLKLFDGVTKNYKRITKCYKELLSTFFRY